MVLPATVAVAELDSAQQAIDHGSGLDLGAEADSHTADRSRCRLYSEAADKLLVVGGHQAVAVRVRLDPYSFYFCLSYPSLQCSRSQKLCLERYVCTTVYVMTKRIYRC